MASFLIRHHGEEGAGEKNIFNSIFINNTLQKGRLADKGDTVKEKQKLYKEMWTTRNK